MATEVAGLTYQTEPPFDKKFPARKVKEIIGQVLKAKLEKVAYHADNTSSWAREIADDIKVKLKGLELERYKYVVQVVIGEQRGEGVRVGTRCFWDANTDNYTSEIFTSQSIFCCAAAFGIYYY